tara:strand:- start:255 stop:1106 length:852 start_codon:yes stop_codon:yes gene_type:complete
MSNGDQMIIWVASYPKSGNTLLRAILSSLLASEDGTFDNNKLSLIPNFPQKRFFEDLTNERANIKEVSQFWIKAQDKINKNRKLRFLKTHNANSCINKNYFTNSKNTIGAIYIVRDPRDVLISAARHYDLPIKKTIELMFDEYAHTLPRKNFEHEMVTFLGWWSYNYNSWINMGHNTLLLKYEDLISNKEKEILKIIKFINHFIPLKIDKKKIKNCIKTTSFKNMANKEEEGLFRENAISQNNEKIKFFNRGSSGTWQDILDNTLAQKIESKFKKEMKKLNYI